MRLMRRARRTPTPLSQCQSCLKSSWFVEVEQPQSNVKPGGVTSFRMSRKSKRGCFLLFLGQADFSEPFMQVCPGRDCRVDGSLSFFDALRQCSQTHVWNGVTEKRHAESRLSPLFARRVHNAVGGGLQFVVGQPLQHVTHIDHEGSGRALTAVQTPSLSITSSPSAEAPTRRVMRLMSSCCPARTLESGSDVMGG